MPAPVPLSTRRDLIRDYLLNGNQTAIAARYNVDNSTLSKWTKKHWWQDEIAELQAAIDFEQRCKARGIIAKAQQQALDRLDQGDPFVLKGGLVVSIPVKALDCARIGTLWLDRLRILEGKPTKISATIGLQQVMHQFQQLASQYQNSPALQEAEVIHSLSTTPTEGK